MTDLSAVSTRDLHEELVRRCGVRELVIGVDEYVKIGATNGKDVVVMEGDGPLRVLDNGD